MTTTNKCDIFKKQYTGHGHNAHPLAGERCYDECHVKKVIPERLVYEWTPEEEAELIQARKDITQIALDFKTDKSTTEGLEQFVDAMMDRVIENTILARKHNKPKQHFCKYCGTPNGSPDPMILCSECRETFGHTYFTEL